jgi:hypothetical protein
VEVVLLLERADWLADGDFEPALVEMIDRARERIDFSIYFFDHPGIERAPIRARRRGVHVRGLVHTHASFAMSYVRRTQRTVHHLVDAGIADLHLGPPGLFTHQKLLLRDREEILLGTGNWLLEDVEIHPQLHVRFTHAALARRIAAHVDKTIATRGTPVPLPIAPRPG